MIFLVYFRQSTCEIGSTSVVRGPTSPSPSLTLSLNLCRVKRGVNFRAQEGCTILRERKTRLAEMLTLMLNLVFVLVGDNSSRGLYFVIERTGAWKALLEKIFIVKIYVTWQGKAMHTTYDTQDRYSVVHIVYSRYMMSIRCLTLYVMMQTVSEPRYHDTYGMPDHTQVINDDTYTRYENGISWNDATYTYL